MLARMDEPFDINEVLVRSRVRRAAGDVPPSCDPQLAQVRRGFYLPRAADLTNNEQYLARIRATIEAREPGLVVCGVSAAALWGIPLMHQHMELVHVSRPGRPRSQRVGVRTHTRGLDESDVAHVQGLLVTDLVRTLRDVAYDTVLPYSLVPLNALMEQVATEFGLNYLQAREFGLGLVESSGSSKGKRRAVKNMAAVDIRAANPGESLSLGQFHVIPVAIPELQVPFPRSDGGNDIADFDWEELDVAGEMDGRDKYLDPDMTKGLSSSEILDQQQVRQSRLLGHRGDVARWGWGTAISTVRMAARLAQHGIYPLRGRGRSRKRS